jgi:hypothetical protein
MRSPHHTYREQLTRSSGAAPLVVLLMTTAAGAQDLTPRAYLITPVGSNAVTISYTWNDGEVAFDASVPIRDARGRFQTQVLSYYRSYKLLGRSANIVVSLPYATGSFKGDVRGFGAQVRTSGMIDGRVRFAVNLHGGPAVRLNEYLAWREKSLIGASLTAVVPTGQYDPARLINSGTNRWAFKPEIGFSRRWRRSIAEVSAALWLFTANPRFYPGDARRTQQPMGAVEAHLGYYLKPRLWASLDGNFWAGGRSSLNDVPKQDKHRDSRAGVTVSIPFTRHQSVKLSYSRGTYITIGGNYHTISTAWQYSWIAKPR